MGFDMTNLETLTDTALQQAAVYGPKLILAILVLIIGLAVINSLTRFIKSILVKRNFDETLITFLKNIL